MLYGLKKDFKTGRRIRQIFKGLQGQRGSCLKSYAISAKFINATGRIGIVGRRDESSNLFVLCDVCGKHNLF
jgi:hypothetical protein